jgi:hypothetical protein
VHFDAVKEHIAFPSRSGLVFTSRQVMHEGWPIMLVFHDAEDEEWQFVNGRRDTEPGMRPMLVHAHHLVELDRFIVELADLPLGWEARRAAPDDDWIREPAPPE